MSSYDFGSFDYGSQYDSTGDSEQQSLFVIRQNNLRQRVEEMTFPPTSADSSPTTILLQPDSHEPTLWAKGIGTFIVCLVGFIGGAFSFHSLRRNKMKMKITTRWYLLQLFIANMAFTATLSFYLFEKIFENNQTLPRHFCLVRRAVLFFNQFASIFFLTLTCYGQYITIWNKSRHVIETFGKSYFMYTLTTLAWVLSLAFCVPMMFNHLATDMQLSTAFLSYSTSLFALGLILVSFLYGSTIARLSKSKTKLYEVKVSTITGTIQSISKQPTDAAGNREILLNGILVCAYILFLLAFLIVYLVASIGDRTILVGNANCDRFPVTGVVLTYINAFINPYICIITSHLSIKPRRESQHPSEQGAALFSRSIVTSTTSTNDNNNSKSSQESV